MGPKERKGLLDEIEDVAARREKKARPKKGSEDDDLDLDAVW